MKFPVYTRKNKLCPRENPILCGKGKLARGLCVPEKGECNSRTLEKRGILTQKGENKGKNYGYVSADLGRGCWTTGSKLKIDYEATYKTFDVVPDSFSLLTYNIWGLAVRPNLRKLFGLRKDLLIKTLKSLNSDMMCLQEMSDFSYNELQDYIKTYKFASEVPYPAKNPERNHSVDVYFMSKYQPRRVVVYGLPGVLGYANALLVVEYPNLIIFNIYSQAGSKLSIGQEDTWIHYSRCRYDLMNIIYDLIKADYADDNVVVCGDFNFHQDGRRSDWPELEMIEKFKKIGFVDTYRKVNKDRGLTEDTDKNLMRWNQKLIEKKLRFDAILYRARPTGWLVNKSKVIGKDLEYLNAEDSQWFYDNVSEAHKFGGVSKLKGVKHNAAGKMLIPINASDHFGVVTDFKLSKRMNRKTSKVSGSKKGKTYKK